MHHSRDAQGSSNAYVCHVDHFGTLTTISLRKHIVQAHVKAEKGRSRPGSVRSGAAGARGYAHTRSSLGHSHMRTGMVTGFLRACEPCFTNTSSVYEHPYFV